MAKEFANNFDDEIVPVTATKLVMDKATDAISKVEVLYCAQKLGIPEDRLNVNGGAISIGHPYGMIGTRMVMHGLIEGYRRGVKYVVISMCIGGQGAAGLFEVP